MWGLLLLCLLPGSMDAGGSVDECEALQGV